MIKELLRLIELDSQDLGYKAPNFYITIIEP